MSMRNFTLRSIDGFICFGRAPHLYRSLPVVSSLISPTELLAPPTRINFCKIKIMSQQSFLVATGLAYWPWRTTKFLLSPGNIHLLDRFIFTLAKIYHVLSKDRVTEVSVRRKTKYLQNDMSLSSR
jgi:hypothetical protein